MTDRWCAVCPCKGPIEGANPENWDCPLLGKKICDSCCTADLMGGMGAPDSLEEMCVLSKRTPQEVHAACRACPHGGPQVGELGKLIYENPDKKKENGEFEDAWKKKLQWLRGES